jgi:hypothetical protein
MPLPYIPEDVVQKPPVLKLRQIENRHGNLPRQSLPIYPTGIKHGLPPVAPTTTFREKLVDMSVFSPRYPPKSHASSSIEDVLRGPGAPGIFNSSKVLDEDYGIYNWCNMPHVRGMLAARS